MQNILLNSTICQLVQHFIWVTGKTKQSCAAFPDAQPKKGLKCLPHINQNTARLYSMDFVQEQLKQHTRYYA